MTEEERYLFDLRGYLVVENAIPPETLARMNGWLDAQAQNDPKWQGGTGNAHLENILTWGPDFRALLDHPRILPIMQTLCGEKLRLDHDYGIFLQPGHVGLPLHGPTLWPYDPCHYYHCINGQQFCGLTVATYALTDVPPDAGGLCVVPGSHKSAFKVPQSFKDLNTPSPIVRQVPCKAGDCVIFTEALIHGTLPWKGPGVRRTLFFKYAPCSIAWENRTYFPHRGSPEMQALESELTEAQRILLAPPSAIDFHHVPTLRTDERS